MGKTPRLNCHGAAGLLRSIVQHLTVAHKTVAELG